MSNFITTTPRNILQPLAFQGLLACQHHTQITERLRTQLGEEAAAIFAEPMFDEMQERIDWYTEYSGVIRPFNELSEQEQISTRARLTQSGKAIFALATQLKDMKDNTSQMAGRMAELALKIPDESFIYLIGDNPVLVAWGFASSNPNETPEDIARLRAPVASSPPSPPPPPPPLVVAASSRAWLWWLLPLLFLALLLLLFFFGGHLSSLFAPSIDTSLSSLTNKRDALKDELAKRAEECQEEALSLPDDAPLEDMAFLEGRWRCDTNIMNARTGQAVIVEYSFDKDGKGSMTIESDRGLCTATATAAMQDSNTLAILTADLIACPEGAPFVGQAILCVRDGDGVSCQGKNQRSTSVWDAQFYRMSEVTP